METEDAGTDVGEAARVEEDVTGEGEGREGLDVRAGRGEDKSDDADTTGNESEEALGEGRVV